MCSVPPSPVFGDRYRIDGRIACGGMSWVFRGTHRALNAPVAVKLLPARASRDPLLAERFMAESRLAARVRSDNVVRIIDAGLREDGGRYAVMEYLDGDTLESELFRRGRLSAKRVCELGAQIAHGLADVHAAGIVHRDIKPANIMLVRLRNGATRCALIDFGIAVEQHQPGAADGDGLVWGTPRFMAPEQARGEALGPPADVYSFGIVLYDMVSGRLPFEDRDPHRVMEAHAHHAPPPIRDHTPMCPPELAELIHRCLHKKPHARPTAEAIADELIEIGRHDDIEHDVEVWRATA